MEWVCPVQAVLVAACLYDLGDVMKVIVTHDGDRSSSPRYYKYYDGRHAVFGAKADAIRVDGDLADMTLRQLHQLNYKHCRLMPETERFKRPKPE